MSAREPLREIRGEGKVEPIDGRVHLTMPIGYLNMSADAAQQLAGKLLIAALTAKGEEVRFPLRWTLSDGAASSASPDWRETLAERLGGKGAVLCPVCEGALGFDCDACPRGSGYTTPQEGGL